MALLSTIFGPGRNPAGRQARPSPRRVSATYDDSSVNLKHQVVSGLRWSAGVRLFSQLFTWAVTLIVVRLLTPADYGLLAMAMVFVGLLYQLAELGLGSAVVQRPEIDVPLLRKTFGLILVVHSSLFLLLFFTAPLISVFMGEPRLVPLVRTLSALFLISAFQVIPLALLQRRMEFRRQSLNDFGSVVVGSVSTLAAALAGWGVWSLVIGSFVTQLGKSIGLNRIAPFRHWPDFSLRGTRQLLTYGGNLTGSSLLGFLIMQADVFIAGKWLGKEIVGFYSVAMHLASLPAQRISGIINPIAFPAFSRMQHDLRQVTSALLTGVRVLAFVSFPMLWGISSVAPEVVSVILGPKWAPALFPLTLLSLMMPLRMFNVFMPNALQGIGRADLLFYNSLVAAILMPVAFFVGIHWGLEGLSLAWVIVTPLVFFENMRRTLPPLGLRMIDLWKALAPSGTAAAAMYAAVAGARWLLPSSLSPLPTLGLLVATGAAVYALGSVAFNRQGSREVVRLLRGASLASPSTSGTP
jgi:O-antigen/teichoic acid export membrane protein